MTALEIRRDVEGYSGMNEDAFARRFYADRAELESLGIHLTVDRPVDGVAEQENYSLRPENFHLPAIAFTDEELAVAAVRADAARRRVRLRRAAAPGAAADLVGPPVARCRRPRTASLALGLTGSAGGHDLSQRLAKVETAIFRRKTITFDYYTMERDEVGARKVDPYHLLFQGGQFYLLGHATSATRCASSACRASAARSPTPRRPSTTSSGPPTSTRAPTPTAPSGSTASPPARPRSGSPTASPGRSSATSAATARSRPADGGVAVHARCTRARASSRRGR